MRDVDNGKLRTIGDLLMAGAPSDAACDLHLTDRRNIEGGSIAVFVTFRPSCTLR